MTRVSKAVHYLQVHPLPLGRRVVRGDLLGRHEALVSAFVLCQPPGEVLLLGVRRPHDQDEVAGVGVHLEAENFLICLVG